MNIGAIFGWDGVIIDSSEQHEESWNVLASEEGLDLPEGHFKKSFGMKNEIIIPKILNWTTDRLEVSRLSLRREEIYRDIVVSSGIGALPGVEEFLYRLSGLRIPCAISSSAPRSSIELAIRNLGIADYFDAIITGEDIIASMPDPQCFILAAQQIRCSPSQCVVFDDAPAGIAAAHNGGMKAVGVATTHSMYDLHEAEIVVKGLDGLNLAHLEDLFHHEQNPAY